MAPAFVARSKAVPRILPATFPDAPTRRPNRPDAAVDPTGRASFGRAARGARLAIQVLPFGPTRAR